MGEKPARFNSRRSPEGANLLEIDAPLHDVSAFARDLEPVSSQFSGHPSEGSHTLPN